jgi:hypothetical protein
MGELLIVVGLITLAVSSGDARLYALGVLVLGVVLEIAEGRR